MQFWLTALRSGQFQQGRGELHNAETDSYCCLGVACEVAYQAGVILHRAVYEGCTSYDGDSTALPKAVREWLGITNASVLLREHTAIFWNDVTKASFAEIADMLENEYLGGTNEVVDMPAL
jgi:hypothetical protein